MKPIHFLCFLPCNNKIRSHESKNLITEGAFLATLTFATLNHKEGHPYLPVDPQPPIQNSGTGHSSYNISVMQTHTGPTMASSAILVTK